jgi:hypothetical protein
MKLTELAPMHIWIALEKDRVDRLSKGIPTITSEKTVSLGNAISEKIKQIVGEYEKNS